MASKNLREIFRYVWDYSGSLGALALLLGVIGSALYWGFNNDRMDLVERYRGLTETSYSKLPEGYGKLTNEPIRSFRFAYKNGQLVKVDHVNRHGVVHHHWEDAPASQVFSYNDGGKLEEKRYLNKDGELMNGLGGYARVVMQYDAKDRLVKEQLFNVKGAPVSAHGMDYAEKIFDYNTKNQLVRVKYFAPNGKPAMNEEGASDIVYTYNAKGEKVEESFWNAGELVNTIYGYARVKMTYDAKGLLVQQEFQSPQQSVAESTKTEDKCAIKAYQYSSQGDLLSERRLDADHNVREEVKYEYDAKNHVLKESHHDAKGKLMIGSGKNYAEKMMEYRDNGKLSIERHKDEYGKTSNLSVDNCGSAVSQRRYLYDENGACSSTIHLHPDGLFCSER